MADCHRESGAEIITVAVRRVNISDRQQDSILSYLADSSYFLLPNTASCKTAENAVRTARLAREAGLSNWIKLEVIRDDH
jgi:thiazole synthase